MAHFKKLSFGRDLVKHLLWNYFCKKLRDWCYDRNVNTLCMIFILSFEGTFIWSGICFYIVLATLSNMLSLIQVANTCSNFTVTKLFLDINISGSLFLKLKRFLQGLNELVGEILLKVLLKDPFLGIVADFYI